MKKLIIQTLKQTMESADLANAVMTFSNDPDLRRIAEIVKETSEKTLDELMEARKRVKNETNMA